MHRSIYCAFVVACFSTPAISQPTPKPRVILAVVEVVQRADECSGAGGEHYVLRVHDGHKPPRVVHAGGHASYLGLIARGWPAKTTFFVAELQLHDPPRNLGGWGCLDLLPKSFDASARRLVRAKSLADAEQLRARLATTGLRGPTPAWGTTVIDPPK